VGGKGGTTLTPFCLTVILLLLTLSQFTNIGNDDDIRHIEYEERRHGGAMTTATLLLLLLLALRNVFVIDDYKHVGTVVVIVVVQPQ